MATATPEERAAGGLELQAAIGFNGTGITSGELWGQLRGVWSSLGQLEGEKRHRGRRWRGCGAAGGHSGAGWGAVAVWVPGQELSCAVRP